MVVYQINVEANYGSTGKIAEALGKMVQDQGGTAYLAHGRKHRPSQLKTLKLGHWWSYAWHLLLSRCFDAHGLASVAATKKLLRHLEVTKPDIIHLHNLHGYYLNYKLLFNYLAHYKGAVVWTLHDCWAFTGHCTHFEPHACEQWKVHCTSCPALNDYPKSYGLDRSKYNFRDKKTYFNKVGQLHLVPVSGWLGAYLGQSFLQNKSQTVIRNGIDLDLFKPSLAPQDPFPNKKVLLGVASVWDRNKGLYDFFTMQEQLREDETLVLVGLSAQQLKALPKGIIGLERTANLTELIQLYTRADGFMNLTYADSYPTTIMEAMACGTPVITYDTGGCTEMVAKCGLSRVIPKGRIDKALEGFRELMAHHESGERANKSRNHALVTFDRGKQLEAYSTLYERLCSMNKN